MPTVTIELIRPIMINGEYFDKGISAQVSIHSTNPWNEPEKINNAFKRIHGIDLYANSFLNSGYLKFY